MGTLNKLLFYDIYTDENMLISQIKMRNITDYLIE